MSIRVQGFRGTLEEETLNPKLLNPKLLNPKPQTLSPTTLASLSSPEPCLLQESHLLGRYTKYHILQTRKPRQQKSNNADF